MKDRKSYAVFGLGRYGMAVAEGLVKAGADVLAVDREEATVNAAAHRPKYMAIPPQRGMGVVFTRRLPG